MPLIILVIDSFLKEISDFSGITVPTLKDRYYKHGAKTKTKLLSFRSPRVVCGKTYSKWAELIAKKSGENLTGRRLMHVHKWKANKSKSDQEFLESIFKEYKV